MSNAKASPMRSYVPGYELREPRNLADALERLALEPGAWKPFAGGTDLMVLLEAGKLQHRKFLSIWKLPELRGIVVTPAHVTLHALTTYSEIRRHELLAREFPLLCRAAAETGSIATQNRGPHGCRTNHRRADRSRQCRANSASRDRNRKGLAWRKTRTRNRAGCATGS